MKLGILFSGGKDSCLATNIAMKEDSVECFISIISKNPHSYMFHTPNISMTEIQAKASNIPLITVESDGEEEIELKELKIALERAKKEYKIQGIVTGAVESVYQATRVQRICDELELYCFNPLWQKPQEELILELINEKFEVIISGVFAEPFDETWLGKKIDLKTLEELKKLNKSIYKISLTGEGGEFETTVLDAPFYKKRIEVKEFNTTYDNYVGNYVIEDYELKEKENLTIGKKSQVPCTKNRKYSDSKTDKVLVDNFSYRLCKSSFAKNAPGRMRQESAQVNCIEKNILIINTSKQNLSELEYVNPIIKTIKESNNYFVKNIEDVTEELVNNKDVKRIIICGTSLKDEEYLKHINKLAFLKNTNKPILGICAGFQILGQIFDETLVKVKEIGMIPVRIISENKLVDEKEINVYSLHKNGFKVLKNFLIMGESENCPQIIKHKTKEIYGISFHPEVRQEKIIKKFLEIN